MPLSAGDKLGPYDVIAAIGAGGMGEVYKARDTRLDRTVAIKVLPEHIARREDLRARFEREARAVASLNHPNICTLYDIGKQDGVGGFMVMELIEGETLAAWIERGALPLDQALSFARQIADALDRAHRAGVTHRDVKPQNIMLTRDGVKVLDFGLAKSSPAVLGPNEATLTKGLTTEGTIMGTPQYMAPEQFEGKEADARSDIWAFGAVLYEMMTGAKAFQGKSYSSLVGAILASDPAPMAVKPFTPRWLERLIRRCLAKDADDRWQTMRDVVIELRSPPAEVAAVVAKPNRWPWAVAVATLIAGVAIGWFYTATRPAPLRPLMHLNVEIPNATPLVRVDAGTGIGGNMFALSPDGERVAVSLRGTDGRVRLHTRLLRESQFTPMAGTENAHGPFFSPDGKWIGFFADRNMKKIAVEGGGLVTLCEAPVGLGGSWGDDGNIIAALGTRTILARVSSDGGKPVAVTKLNAGEETHRWPQVLPGSKAVLFTASTTTGLGYDNANIEVLSLPTGERKILNRAGYFPRYFAATTGSAGSGHLAYLHRSTLFAAPFHPGRLALAGSPVPTLENVGSTMVAGADFTFAGNGTAVYLAGKSTLDLYPISWLDRGGKTAQPLHAPAGRYLTPRFSPDGKRLAFAMASGKGQDIWVKDLDRDTTSRLSFLPGENNHPVWTPEGKNIVFYSSNPAAPGLYRLRSDGSGEAKRLTEGRQLPFSFSPDGKRIAIAQTGSGGSFDIFTLPVEADSGPGAAGIRLGNAELFLGTPFSEISPAFSPDGRWLAYQSDESGILEVYVRPFFTSGEGTGGRWQVSTAGGRDARWSRDGRDLLFQGLDGRVMAAGYTARGDTFTAGKPRVWTEIRVRTFGVFSTYDIEPDGKRLAAMAGDEFEAAKLPTSLTVLVNFGDELRRKAPAGGIEPNHR